MTPQLTVNALKAMHFSGMAAEFQLQLDDPASYAQLGFEERFSMLVTAEFAKRQQNKLERLLHQARFPAPRAAIEEIEYFEDRNLDKGQIQRLAPVSTSTKDIISFSKAPLEAERPFWLALLATPLVASSRRCAISVCLSCWMN